MASTCPWVGHLVSRLWHPTNALFGLAFAGAPPLKGLTGRIPELAGSLCKRHAVRRLNERRPPTACRHGVSGSVSSPCRGSSHHSVALLGSLSVVARYLALRDGPRRFGPGSTCPTLLGYHSKRTESVTYGTVTRCGAPFQAASVESCLCDSLDRNPMSGPTTPPGDPDGLG